MKLFENEYETVLAETPLGAKAVIQREIDDHLDLEEIGDFKVCEDPQRIVYNTWKQIPKCIRALDNIKLEMVPFSYFGSGKYFGITVSLDDWEKIADDYIEEEGGQFVSSSEY